MQLSQARRLVGAIDFDQFFASGCAVQDANGPPGQVQRLGQELHQRCVRRPTDGGRLYLDLEGIAVPAHDTRSCRAWLYMNL